MYLASSMISLRRAGGLVLLLGALGGCEAIMAPSGAVTILPVGTITRTPADLAMSALTGLDCNVARLSSGHQYCQPIEPPAQPPFCTHSLATIDCWNRPDPFGYDQRQVADAPSDL